MNLTGNATFDFSDYLSLVDLEELRAFSSVEGNKKIDSVQARLLRQPSVLQGVSKPVQLY